MKSVARQTLINFIEKQIPVFHQKRLESLASLKLRQVLARKNQYDNTKYHDPESTARDPMKHLELADLLQRVIDMTERSAYVSVRGKQSVEVSAPTVLPAASAASR